MLPTLKYSESPVWNVVFARAKFDHWIWRIIDREMGHVYAIQDLNDYQWLVVQPRLNIVEVKIMLKCQYPHIRMITGPDVKILTVTCSPENKPRGGLNWFNCVEQVKALIGVKSFWTFTPKQLYKGLVDGKYSGDRGI